MISPLGSFASSSPWYSRLLVTKANSAMAKKGLKRGRPSGPLSLLDVLWTGVAGVVAPDSLILAYDKLPEANAADVSSASRAMSQVRPGDIILVTTPGMLYTFVRRATNNPYDHAAVVVAPDRVVHIGPPRVRMLRLERAHFVHRNP